MRIRAALFAIGLGLAAVATACASAQLAEMQRQVDAQNAQIESQAREIAQFRAQQQPAGTTPAPPGSCDDAVMRKALARGDEQLAAGKLELALGYYHDATVACPGNARAELSLAQVYEKLGDRRQAARHYQNAREAAGADSALAEQASEGMMRVGGPP
jgi:Tfp pilus assembly protein PilF